MTCTLRIELWNNDKNIPFRIESQIENVHSKLHEIIKNVAMCMPDWKYLEKCEASIGTVDEKKQIRHINCSYKPTEIIDFSDQHISSKKDLTVSEWKQFAKLIEREINNIISYKCRVLLISDISS